MLTPLGRHACRRCLPLICLLFLLLSAAGTQAATSPGQIDLGSLGFSPAAEADTDLAIGSSDFAVAALIAQSTDPDLAALLANVQAFSLVQYSPPDAATITAAQALLTAIVNEGWLLVQSETQGSRQVTVYTKADGAVIAGLTVIAIDAGREVSIANVVGNIQPPQLATLGLPIP